MAVSRDYLAIAGHISKKASMLGVMALTALKRRWMLLSATVGDLGFCGVSNLDLIDGYINNLNTKLIDKHCTDMKVASHVNAYRVVVLMERVFVGNLGVQAYG